MPDARLYLDYAATTPLDPAVRRAMLPHLRRVFGNPSSLHAEGQEAQAAVDRSREVVARLLSVGFREVVFTGSATEANNLALRGAVRGWRAAHPGVPLLPRLLVSAVEHESVLETVRDLERRGEAEVKILPVDGKGVVLSGALSQTLDDRTALVSVQYVNNETGVRQDVPALAEAVKSFRERRGGTFPLFHTDAVQAFTHYECALSVLGVDLLTLSAHKCYGPKGVGVLAGKVAALAPLLTGGGQEFGVRSGTHNVAGIVGGAEAFSLAAARRARDTAKTIKLAKLFLQEITSVLPDITVNGVSLGEASRAPHILNLALPRGCTLDLVVALDQAGVAVSTGSACASRAALPSHVLRAMGFPEERIRRSFRVSFGRMVTPAEIREAAQKIHAVLSA